MDEETKQLTREIADHLSNEGGITPIRPELVGLDLPARLRVLRLGAGLSGRELSRLIGGVDHTISRYERGARTPSFEKGVKLIVLFDDLYPDFTPEDLVGEIEIGV